MFMMYILLKNSNVVGFTHKNVFTGTSKFADTGENLPEFDQVLCEHDLNEKTFEQVQVLADEASAFFGTTYIAAENRNCSPKYRIIAPPKVGDPVSYTFNGDYTPCGHVVKVTKTLMVRTSTGKCFRRKGRTAAWVLPGGTFSLVHGHVDRRNPEF